MSIEALDLYESVGVKPVINALGPRTLLGGSEPHPDVLKAMNEAGRFYADMDELFEQSGRVISDLIDCPAALVTSGCAAALVLGTAACVTGDDPKKMAQLPEMMGLKDEVVIQASQHYKYERVVRMVGVRLVEAGNKTTTTKDDLEAVLGGHTAAILYPDIDSDGDILSLEDVIEVAHAHDIPVIVDSAYRVYPVELFKKYSRLGADLFGFGAKYFGAPNSTGLLCGREDLVSAARMHSFSGFEKRDLEGFGRPFKVDRQEVFGVLAALRIWLDMDHEARFDSAHKRAGRLLQLIDSEFTISCEQGSTGLNVIFSETEGHLNSERVARELLSGIPSIWANTMPDKIYFDMLLVHDGDEEIIAKRLLESLHG